MDKTNKNELSDNISVFELNGSQFVMQIMAVKNSQLKNTSSYLTSSSTGNLTSVNYNSKDVLLRKLPEKKKNLAAALLLRQLKQRQKEQQHRKNFFSVINAPLTSDSKEPSLNKQLISRNSQIRVMEQMSFNKKVGYNRRVPYRHNLKTKCVILQTLNNCINCQQMIKSEDFKQHQLACQPTTEPTNLTVFSCQLCQNSFQDQLSFFEHLKIHYEPVIEIKKIEEVTKERRNINVNISNEFSPLSDDDLYCTHCNINFRQVKDYKDHIQDVHIKIELDEFNDDHSVDDAKSWGTCHGIEEICIKEEYCSEPEEKDYQ